MAISGAVFLFTLVVCFATFTTEVTSKNLLAPLQTVYQFNQLSEAVGLGSVKIDGNKVVDEIIKLAKSSLVEEEKTIQPKEFMGETSSHLFFITIPVYYHGYDGRIGGLSTLYRSGKAQVSFKGDTVSIQMGLGLHRASLSYMIHISSPILRMTRRVTITVSGIAIRAKVSKDLSKVSSMKLDEVRVTSVGKGHCHIDHLGVLTGLVDRITTNIFNKNEHALAQKGEESIRKVLTKALANSKF